MHEKDRMLIKKAIKAKKKSRILIAIAITCHATVQYRIVPLFLSVLPVQRARCGWARNN
ncbi:MAG: hypothetical protein JW891_02610 [Candidatus Lokiarchaeota archaeon]|nr:hypothetical protein [Candidatus Lokiarchaeota archaeon]